MSGLDHISFQASDYDKSRAFYIAALAPLGINAMMEFGEAGERTTGFGDSTPFFWLGEGDGLVGRLHVSFSAGSHAQVQGFHAAAMAAGALDNGGPGLRAEYHPTYYAAFVLDPDGHNIEAVCHAPE
jgi:catechol 2,3-dioxygenase-like lactoylglutathione lyase family enzyme